MPIKLLLLSLLLLYSYVQYFCFKKFYFSTEWLFLFDLLPLPTQLKTTKTIVIFFTVYVAAHLPH
jgi:hypothetical protein